MMPPRRHDEFVPRRIDQLYARAQTTEDLDRADAFFVRAVAANDETAPALDDVIATALQQLATDVESTVNHPPAGDER